MSMHILGKNPKSKQVSWERSWSMQTVQVNAVEFREFYECTSCNSPYRASPSFSLITLELNSPEKYSIWTYSISCFIEMLLWCLTYNITIYTKPEKTSKWEKYWKFYLFLLNGEGHAEWGIKIIPVSFQSILFTKGSKSFKRVNEQQPHTQSLVKPP